MAFEPTIKELIDRCKELAIDLDPVIVKNTLNKTPKTTKYSRWELTKKIVDVNLPVWYNGKIPSSAKFINAMESAMMCARITDMKDEEKEVLLADNNEYYAERKFNGCRCLSGETLVVLDNGTTETIKNIVDNKLQVNVLSYNHDTNKVESKRITGWFKNPDRPSTDWCKIRGIDNSKVVGYQKVQKNFITKDHKIFSHDRYAEVKEANTINALYRTLSKIQWDVVYGMILGDSWLYRDKRSDKCNTNLCFCHGIKQEDYFNKLLQSLQPFVQNNTRKYTSGYGSEILSARTTALKELNNLSRDVIISKEKLSPLSIAIWYMDDGHMNQSNLENSSISNKINRPTFNTHRYSHKQLEGLQELLLNSVYLETTIQKKDNGYVLVGTSESSMDFYELIAPFIPESLAYKVPKCFRDLCGSYEWWNDTEFAYYVEEQEIVIKMASETAKVIKMEECYDIEVEDNHNYFANGFLVHNCRITYTPKEGFKFYSNNRDTDTLLITEWTDKVLLIKDGEVKHPEDFKGMSDSMFILDSEILVDTKHVDTSKYGGQGETESELNAITTILQLEPEDSQDVQLNQEKCQLKFYPFDIIYLNKNLMKEPLKNRNKIRDKVLEKLQNWGLPFYNTKRVYKDKKQYFETLVNSGGEGIILKNENECYTPDKTRNKHRQIKMKRSISAMMGEDIDGFIIGFEPSDPTKGLKDYIGAIKIGTNLIKVDGSEEVHHIASISGMPLELRKQLTVLDEEGKPTLNPEYLGKCLTFDGFDVKLRSMRFSHARVIDWATAWRPDKDRHDCTIDEEILLQNVL